MFTLFSTDFVDLGSDGGRDGFDLGFRDNPYSGVKDGFLVGSDVCTFSDWWEGSLKIRNWGCNVSKIGFCF